MRRVHRRNRVPSDSSVKLDIRFDSGFMSGVDVQDRSQSGNHSSAKGTVGTPVPVYPGFNFVATSLQYIDIGASYNAVNTVLLWVKPDDVVGLDFIIDLNGTDYLLINSGTVFKNGFAGGTAVLYVDGVAGTTVTANWHMVAITDTVGKDASDLDIGRIEAGEYLDGRIGGVMLFSRVLTPAEMRDIYNVTKFKYQMCGHNRLNKI